MLKAHNVMTGSLVTCSPDDSVAEAARMMRDRNTGDVLVTDDGKLMGIVTDRDIAVRVAAKQLDPAQVPVRSFMSKRVVTGQPTWDLDKIAKTMGRHQVRRLPIVDKGMLVGIVSLGDLALRNNHKGDVAQSLKQISEPGSVHRIRSKPNRALPLLLMAGVAAAVVALTLSPKSLSTLWDQLQDSGIPDKVLDALEQGRDLVSQYKA